MTDSLGLRQRIAVVDSVPRSREHARRAIRGLGHAPMVFADVQELLAVGRCTQKYSLMYFGIPSGAPDLRQMVDQARDVVGREVPIMFVASANDSKSIKDLGRIQRKEMLATPSSFSDIYNSLEGFMIRHGLPLSEDGLAWGSYRFFPACSLAKVAGAEVWLDALEFELALELFYNVDRPLSSDWLRGMVTKPPVRSWARWLDSRVDHLRRQLDLGAPGDWSFGDARCRGYRLSRVMKKARTPTSFSIERCFQT